MTVLSLIAVLVVIPAVFGYCFYLEFLDQAPFSPGGWRQFFHSLFHRGFEAGDFLVYRKEKVSSHPGPRARNVTAAERGEDYYYEVDKFWTVEDVLNDGRLVARTRTGKQIYLTPEDEHLRKARLLERVRFRDRFPAL
jgi:hypothetical protein